MLNTPVLDLSTTMAALASFGGVSGVLSVLRILFLDRLTARLDPASQNIILRGALLMLNFAAIVGLALLFGATPGRSLVVSALLATAGASTAGHFLFVGTKQLATARAGVPNAAKVEPPVTSSAS